MESDAKKKEKIRITKRKSNKQTKTTLGGERERERE